MIPLNPFMFHLLKAKGDTVAVESSSNKTLDHNHNIFLLVDDGTTDKFGREIEFRAAFEAGARKRFNQASVVTIVIQGGPGTLETALRARQVDTPIVVIDGSGKAADVLAYAWKFLHSAQPQHAGYSVKGLERLIAKSFPPPEKKPNEATIPAQETPSEATKSAPPAQEKPKEATYASPEDEENERKRKILHDVIETVSVRDKVSGSGRIT